MAVDYAFALPTMLFTAMYAAELGSELPLSVVACAVLALAALAAGWVWDQPRQYFVLHGAWHIFGAAAVSELARAHAALLPP